MGVCNGMFPLLAGTEQAARQFAANTLGARKADFDGLRARSGIIFETWAVQETPMGNFMLVWFRGQVLDITGVDLAAPPDGPPPEVVVDWHA